MAGGERNYETERIQEEKGSQTSSVVADTH